MVDTREQFGGLWHLYLWVMVVVCVAVTVATLVPLVVFHRRRRGEGPGSRTRESRLGEPLYALGLGIVVVVLVTATFRTESRVDAVAAAPRDTVRVTAFQWGWTFAHAGHTVTGDDIHPPTLHVRAHETIRFIVTSRDVIHAFWVPRLRFKRDAYPQRETSFDLVFDRPGDYVGRCAEFCGLQHAGMGFLVRAS